MQESVVEKSVLSLFLSFIVLGVAAGASSATAGVAPRVPAPLEGVAVDPEEGCQEMTPAAHSADAVQGAGANVNLETLVFLDGVSRRDAKRAVEVMAQSYTPLGITVVPRFEKIVIPGADRIDGDELNAAAKRVHGGARPKGTDVVHTFTSKDLHSAGVDIAGLADCIGGVRYPKRAFSTSELYLPDGGSTAETDWGNGMTAAHELGHLLGARHEYFNCIEGTPPPSVCTLMSPIAINIGGGVVPRVFSNHFGSLERAVVRGYAEEFAAP